jgi:hypothetical protein
LKGYKERSPRHKVRLQGRMRGDREWIDVSIKDLSETGLMAECACPPSRGHYIEIRRYDHSLVGVVVWSKENRFGVCLADKAEMQALISGKRQPRDRDRRDMTTRTTSRRAIVLSTPSDWRWVGQTLERAAIMSLGIGGTLIIGHLAYEALSLPLREIASGLRH